jgi:hypothetical protein
VFDFDIALLIISAELRDLNARGNADRKQALLTGHFRFDVTVAKTPAALGGHRFAESMLW